MLINLNARLDFFILGLFLLYYLYCVKSQEVLRAHVPHPCICASVHLCICAYVILRQSPSFLQICKVLGLSLSWTCCWRLAIAT